MTEDTNVSSRGAASDCSDDLDPGSLKSIASDCATCSDML